MRRLTETVQQKKFAPAENGVIPGVRVLGRFSSNAHGVDKAKSGTEYPVSTMEAALKKYEGARVCCNHLSRPDAVRQVQDVIGSLRDLRIDATTPGDECMRADLHALTTEMGRSLIEDWNRDLGIFGLSHDAYATKEHMDGDRLVIDEIGEVCSVDVVFNPATNRNLKEEREQRGTTMKITFRKLIERQFSRWSTNRILHAKRLIEDDGMSDSMEDEMDVAPEVADSNDALKDAFAEEIKKVFKGDGTAEEKLAKIEKMVNAYHSTTDEEDPGEPTDEEDELDDKGKPKVKEDDEDEKGKKKEEDDAAKKKEGDGEDDEKKKQESRELAVFRAQSKARKLCESMNFTPKERDVEIVAQIPDDAQRRVVIEAFKKASSLTRTTSARPLQEEEKKGPQTDAERAAIADAAAVLNVPTR